MTAQASVVATARLHLGFLDMNGSLRRRFGGIGLSLDHPRTRLTLEEAAATSVEGAEAARAEKLLAKARDVLAPGAQFRLVVHEAIPAHSGFGSGTQLALSIASAVRRLRDLPFDPAADAALLERGARSGLGAGLFQRGGVVVDGGRGAGTLTPPVIAHAHFPEDWRVLLLSDPEAAGLHGSDEREAFAALPPLSEAMCGELCRRVLMQALPALAERDLAAFGAAIARIQEIVGDHFAPAQGGRRYTSARVEAAAAFLTAQGAVGQGQTSWGPTGFVFVESEGEAQRLVQLARGDEAARGADIVVARGLDRGARIDAVYATIA